jgi:hypothetical protein
MTTEVRRKQHSLQLVSDELEAIRILLDILNTGGVLQINGELLTSYGVSFATSTYVRKAVVAELLKCQSYLQKEKETLLEEKETC